MNLRVMIWEVISMTTGKSVREWVALAAGGGATENTVTVIPPHQGRRGSAPGLCFRTAMSKKATNGGHIGNEKFSATTFS